MEKGEAETVRGLLAKFAAVHDQKRPAIEELTKGAREDWKEGKITDEELMEAYDRAELELGYGEADKRAEVNLVRFGLFLMETVAKGEEERRAINYLYNGAEHWLVRDRVIPVLISWFDASLADEKREGK